MTKKEWMFLGGILSALCVLSGFMTLLKIPTWGNPSYSGFKSISFAFKNRTIEESAYILLAFYVCSGISALLYFRGTKSYASLASLALIIALGVYFSSKTDKHLSMFDFLEYGYFTAVILSILAIIPVFIRNFSASSLIFSKKVSSPEEKITLLKGLLEEELITKEEFEEKKEKILAKI